MTHCNSLKRKELRCLGPKKGESCHPLENKGLARNYTFLVIFVPHLQVTAYKGLTRNYTFFSRILSFH